MYFLGSSLSLLRCLFCVMGKRSSVTGSVMVAPEHLIFHDRMSRPSLGDILKCHHHSRQTSPLLPDNQELRMAPLSSISKTTQVSRVYLQSFAQICIPAAPTLAYKDYRYYSPCLPPPQCYYSPSPPLTTNNLVLCAMASVRLTTRTDPPVTKVVLTAVPARAHCCKIQMQG